MHILFHPTYEGTTSSSSSSSSSSSIKLFMMIDKNKDDWFIINAYSFSSYLRRKLNKTKEKHV